MKEQAEKVQLQHPDPDKTAPRISTYKYKMVKGALLTVVPKNDEGVPFKGLSAMVEGQLSSEELNQLGSVGWYTTTVK